MANVLNKDKQIAVIGTLAEDCQPHEESSPDFYRWLRGLCERD